MNPQHVSITKAAPAAFAAFFALCALLLALAGPASAQDDPATATIGGADCAGDNVQVTVMTTASEEMLTENVTPDADGSWTAPLTIPAVSEPVIVSATCFGGDVILVNYSPISLRVQPGVAVGGIIELPGTPVDGAAAPSAPDDSAAAMPDELPETGPFTVPATGLALAMIAAGTGMAFVARQEPTDATPAADNASAWPASHWDS